MRLRVRCVQQVADHHGKEDRYQRLKILRSDHNRAYIYKAVMQTVRLVRPYTVGKNNQHALAD